MLGRIYDFMEEYAYALIIGVVIAFFLLMPAACTDTDDAVDAAENLGFSDVEVVSTSWFFANLQGCGRDDTRIVKMRATNPTGQEVEITGCVSWLKHATIRS